MTVTTTAPWVNFRLDKSAPSLIKEFYAGEWRIFSSRNEKIEG